MGPSVTFILMMYNEAPNIVAALDEAIDWAAATMDDWEIVVVDDGSSDGCADIVEGYAARNPHVHLVRHAKNRGMGAAMATGVRAATKEYFVCMASDLQVPMAEFGKLLPLLAQAPIVLTVYGNRPNSAVRTAISRSFRVYMRALAGIRFQLESYVLFPTALGQELLEEIECDTFFFSFEIVQRAIERGYRTATARIASRPRVHGESKVANLRRIKQVAREVLAYRRRRAR